MRPRPLLCSLSLLLLCSAPLAAQPAPPVRLGITVGLTENFHETYKRTIDEPSAPHFTDGRSTGYLVGLSGMILTDSVGEWGLVSRIGYERRPGHFVEEMQGAEILSLHAGPNDPEPVIERTVAEAEVRYDLLATEILIAWRFAAPGSIDVRLAAGPAAQFLLSSNFRQSQHLVSPENIRFANSHGIPSENNGRTLIFSDGEVYDSKGLRLSLKGGVIADIDFGAWSISPSISFDYALTDLTGWVDWKVHSLIGQIDLRYSL